MNVVRQNKSRKTKKKTKKKPKNLTNWVGGLVIRFLFQRKSSILYLWGFNIMHVYTCIVSVDSYSGVRVSLIWLPPHSLTDVKMKNLHVCIFFFPVVSENTPEALTRDACRMEKNHINQNHTSQVVLKPKKETRYTYCNVQMCWKRRVNSPAQHKTVLDYHFCANYYRNMTT